MLKHPFFYVLTIIVTVVLLLLSRCFFSFSFLTFLLDKRSQLPHVSPGWLVFLFYWSVQYRGQHLTPSPPRHLCKTQAQRPSVGSALLSSQGPPFQCSQMSMQNKPKREPFFGRTHTHTHIHTHLIINCSPYLCRPPLRLHSPITPGHRNGLSIQRGPD